MGGEPERVPQPLTGALSELPAWAGQLIDSVLTRDDPELALRLRRELTISVDDHRAVKRLLTTEFSTQVSGPDWEPTAYGKQVDDALGQFFLRYPTDR